MSLPTLTALRDHLKADASISAWFAARYPGKTVRHFIGYKKPAGANDYPAICYVPVRDRRRTQGNLRVSNPRVSIVIAIAEKGVTDDVFDGVAQLDAITALIEQSLLDSGFYIEDDEIIVTGDMGMTHPFYEQELSFVLLKSP